MRFALILIAASAFGQTTNYPGTVDTDTSLFVTADNVQSTLNAAMGAGDTAAVVASGTGFAANQIATICETTQNSTGKCTAWEHMLITAVNGNILTVTRGFAGTSAVAHAKNKTVSILIDSVHQKVLKDAVIALEKNSGPVINVVGLGADSTGVADSTVAINAAITQAATANGGTVYLPCGTYKISSELHNEGNNVDIVGEGQCSVINPRHTTGYVIHLNGTGNVSGVGSRNSVRNLFILSSAANGTRSAIYIDNQNTVTVDRVYIYNTHHGILIDGAATFIAHISSNNITAYDGDAIRQLNGADVYIQNNSIFGIWGLQPNSGITIIGSGGTQVHFNDVGQAGIGLNVVPPDGYVVVALKMSNNYFDTNSAYGAYFSATGSGHIQFVTSSSDWFASNGINGLYVGAGVDGATFSNCEVIRNFQDGIFMQYATKVEFDGCKASGNNWYRSNTVNTSGTTVTNVSGFAWQDYYFGKTITINGSPYTVASVSPSGQSLTITTSAGTQTGVTATIGASNTYNGMHVAADTSYWSVIGGTYGQSGGLVNQQRYGMLIDSGTSDYFKIINPSLANNVAFGLVDQATGIHRTVEANQEYVTNTSASAASVNLGQDDSSVFYITGTTQITTLTPIWIKRTVRLIFTNATPGGVGTGGNIARAQSAVIGQVITLTSPDGVTWY